MKKTQLFGVIALIFSLVLSILLPILFEMNGILVFNDAKFIGEGTEVTWLGADLAIYITSKVIVSIFLIVVSISVISGKNFVAFSILGLVLTYAIQLLPLVNRLLAQVSWLPVEGIQTFFWSINLLVTILVLFAYVLLVFILKLNSDKTKKVEEFAKPQEIKVQPTTSYLDSNGDLKGPGQN